MTNYVGGASGIGSVLYSVDKLCCHDDYEK
jgi:hypothetical protein